MLMMGMQHRDSARAIYRCWESDIADDRAMAQGCQGLVELDVLTGSGKVHPFAEIGHMIAKALHEAVEKE